MILELERTVLPPDDLLPPHIQKLAAERDKAFEAADDFLAEHDTLLSDRWEEIYETRDMVAAAEAAAQGNDPMKVPSELEKARALRPRIVGAARGLVRRANQADQKLVAEWRKVVADLAPVARERLEEAAKKYEEAYRAFQAVRAEFGDAAYLARYVHAAQGHYMPDFKGGPQTPRRIDSGAQVKAAPGPLELKEVMDSFKRAENQPVERMVKVVSDRNGMVLTLAEAQARALVGSNGGKEVGLRILEEEDDQ